MARTKYEYCKTYATAKRRNPWACKVAKINNGLYECFESESDYLRHINSKKRKYHTSASLKERGWSDTMIKNILGEPDDYMDNPHYKCAAPMRLWTVEHVRKAERRKVFKEAAAKYAARKDGAAAAARKAVETKREKCLSYARTVTIDIPVMPKDELLTEAIDSYNEWHLWDRRCLMLADKDSDPDFLNRITVNYLRHECTEYDEHLRELSGSVGIEEAHDILKGRVNEAICKTYPHLHI